jgi:hypothetical protein
MDQDVRADNFRQRAAEIKAIAASIDDDVARATMQNLAADYERMAAEIDTRRRANATGATPQEAARRLMLLYVEIFRRRAGEAVRLQVLQSPFLADGWTLIEFYDGLFHAGSEGWLEFKNGEGILTARGAKVI